MAYKPKAASYFIQQIHPNEWKLNKFDGSGGGDSSTPSQTYTIKGDPLMSGRWMCDCPATWGGKNRKNVQCKHGPWVARWINIHLRNQHQGKVIYYDSSDDKFHKVEGLDVIGK